MFVAKAKNKIGVISFAENVLGEPRRASSRGTFLGLPIEERFLASLGMTMDLNRL
jgi:hypothetical protein